MERVPEPEVMDGQAEAAAYAAADFRDVNAAFAERLDALAAELLPPGAREAAVAADLGAGPADIPARVLAFRPGWRIAAVDAAPAMLALARASLPPEALRRIALVRADAKATPFPEGSLDVVFSNSILHHLPDPAPFWRELRRIAAPGALVLLRDLARPASESAARAIVRTCAAGESELLRKEFYDSLRAAFTVEEVRAGLAAAGLGALRVEPASDRHLDVLGRLD